MKKLPSLTSFASTPKRNQAPEPAEEKEEKGPAAAEKRQILFRLSPEAFVQLKILAAEQGGLSTQKVMEEAVEDLFRKHGKPPIV